MKKQEDNSLLANPHHTSSPRLFERVCHKVCWVVIGLPSEPCGVSLNAPRRSRPASEATACQCSRYLCQGRTSPHHWPPGVGPLGSTSTVRNGFGCSNVGHKIIITALQREPVVNIGTHVCRDHEKDKSKYTNTHPQCSLIVYKLSSLKLFLCWGELYWAAGVVSVSGVWS